jgi:dTDP-4-dehydrorhamnose 3,5-epimerase
MKAIATDIHNCFLIQPTVFADSRGYFLESFNTAAFAQATGQQVSFVQDNESCSNYGVIRGLHFQTGVQAQAKLVRVVQGAVLDVVVDLRPTSPSYLKHIAVELSAANKHQLYIPIGCAHGFSVLNDNTIFLYKCSALYSKAHEGAINPLDAELAINWQIPIQDAVISEKDTQAPSLKHYLLNPIL